MKFLEKKNEKKDKNSSSNINLQGDGEVVNDDDSCATRGSRTIGFTDEPVAAATIDLEQDYSTRHARSFLDPVSFTDNALEDLDEDYDHVEEMTDSQRESRFKAAELAELTNSQRENRSNFLNESLHKRTNGLVAKGAPLLGGVGNSNQEMNGLIDNNGPQHDNLMVEEGIPMDLLDAKERYQDGFIMDATKLADKRARCFRFSRVGAIFVLIVVIITVGSIGIVHRVEQNVNSNNSSNNSNSLNLQIDQKQTEKIETPSIDSKFWGVTDPNDDDADKYMTENEEDHQNSLFCIDDPDFLHNGKTGENCRWVELTDTVARCTRDKVSENCRATCDPKCVPPTGFPTEVPTDAASDPPTFNPSWIEYFPTDDPTSPSFPSSPPTDSPEDNTDDTEDTDFPTELPTGFPTDIPTES